jgi:TolB-like protein
LDDLLLERLRRALAPEFDLDGQLAAGGMGIVFRAREVALDRQVAIKVLRPELATATARERFLQEARLLARLQHPNIVPIHRADEREGLSYYVMDFIEGQTLADRLADGPLPPAQLGQLREDLLSALAAAHGIGIVHRDVKPHNIFFDGYRAQLADFGIARDEHRDGEELTEEGLLIGTREYMAPEQLAGRPGTERSDQFSAAAVLYQAATGRSWETLDTPSRADWSGVPRPMARVLRRALATDPAERWPSVGAMRLAFRRAALRLWAVAAVGMAATVVVAIAVWNAIYHETPRDHRALALLPFTTVGIADASLGPDVSRGTDINLGAWFPGLSRVPLNVTREWTEAHPADELATARLALDVDYLVSGSITRGTERLRLTVMLTDSAGTRELGRLRLRAGDSLAGSMGDSAAFLIGTSLGPRPPSDIRNLASTSPAAMAAFLDAETLFDNDAWHAAARRYGDAIAEDSTFVLARWRQLVAQIWSRDFSWDNASRLAACCAGQLPPLDSGLVRAMADTNLPERFAAFDSLHDRFGDVEPLPLLYASDLFHRGPLVGRGLPTSLRMFEEAIAARPGGTPAPAFDQLVWGYVRLGNREEARRWLRERGKLATSIPGEPPITEFLRLGYDLRWVRWRARLKLWYLGRSGTDADLRELGKFFRFSAAWDIPEGQEDIGRLIATRLFSRDRASGLEARGLARFAWGQIGEGLQFIDSAARYFQTPEAELQRRQWRLLLPALGAGRATTSEEADARTWLRGQALGGRFQARARWTLAIDAVQRHDSAAAADILAGLETLGQADSAAAQLSRLATAIWRGEYDPRGALASSEALLRFDSPSPGNDIFTRSLLHLSRARWLEAIGDQRGASREILWYENSDTYQFPVAEAQKMEVDEVASVGARVTRARLLLAEGDTAVACHLLARVRQLWRNADPSVAPAAQRADTLRRSACP